MGLFAHQARKLAPFGCHIGNGLLHFLKTDFALADHIEYFRLRHAHHFCQFCHQWHARFCELLELTTRQLRFCGDLPKCEDYLREFLFAYTRRNIAELSKIADNLGAFDAHRQEPLDIICQFGSFKRGSSGEIHDFIHQFSGIACRAQHGFK